MTFVLPQEAASEVVETSRGFVRVLPRSVDDIKGALLPDTIGDGLRPGEKAVNVPHSYIVRYSCVP